MNLTHIRKTILSCVAILPVAAFAQIYNSPSTDIYNSAMQYGEIAPPQLAPQNNPFGINNEMWAMQQHYQSQRNLIEQKRFQWQSLQQQCIIAKMKWKTIDKNTGQGTCYLTNLRFH